MGDGFFRGVCVHVESQDSETYHVHCVIVLLVPFGLHEAGGIWS